MSLASLISSVAAHIAAAWEAVVEKGGEKASPANLANMITALNSIGLETSVTPAPAPSNPDNAQAIAILETHLGQLYNMVETKNGVVPENKNFENLAEAILSIPVEVLDMGTLHYMEGDTLKHYQITSQEELNLLSRGSYRPDSPYEFKRLTVYPDDIIGYDFGKDVVAMPQLFCNYLPNYNWPITLDQTIWCGYSPGGTLSSCYWFSHLDSQNSPITVTENFAYSDDIKPITLGSMFQHNPSFNQPFTLPSFITSTIGLLDGCSSFNQPMVYGPQVVDIGGLLNCPGFVGPLTIQCTNRKSYEGMMLNMIDVPNAENSRAFTQGVTLNGPGASDLLSILTNYNGYQSGKNIYYRNIIGAGKGWQPSAPTPASANYATITYTSGSPTTVNITNASDFEDILNGNYKFRDVPFELKFNADARYSSSSVLRGAFLQGTKVNRITGMANLTGIAQIGTNFLADTNIVSIDAIPSSVTSIGTGFLSRCFEFNADLTIPSTVTNIGMFGFMYRQDTRDEHRDTVYAHTITFNCPTSAFDWEMEGLSGNDRYNTALSYGSDNSSAASFPYYVTGVSVGGSAGSYLVSTLGDRTGQPQYGSSNIKVWRKLILAN